MPDRETQPDAPFMGHPVPGDELDVGPYIEDHQHRAHDSLDEYSREEADDPLGHDRHLIEPAYDHDAYMERYGEAQAILMDALDHAFRNGLEDKVRDIVLLDELCDPDSPRDGLYYATFANVMARLLSSGVIIFSRPE